MKKISFLFIILTVILSFDFNSKIYAQENENTEVTKQEDKEKEQIITLINECLNNIELKINNIDQKVEKVKKQKEFEYYPAIRLNVDSPILGMKTVLENKLRVKKDITTSDVASKYSIRDIIKNKKIKLPDSYLGAIIVSTREVSIDSTMELPEAKLVLVKCIQYLSQVNSAEDFLDNQINNIFRDYIDENKRNNINNIKSRVTDLQKELVDISDNITILGFLDYDVNEYKEKYNEISKELYQIGKEAKNTLILDETLNELNKNIVNTEAKVLDLKDNVEKAYKTSINKMDYAKFLDKVEKDIEARTNAVNKYIEGSKTVKKEKVDNKDVEETIINYSVTSNATLDYMKLSVEYMQNAKKEEDNRLKEEREQEQEEEKEETETQDTVVEQEEQKSDEEIFEENNNKIKDIYSKYKEFLNREYKFYTDNINMLLKDTNDKVSSIISEIDSGINVDNKIFDYTKYIYIDLPNNLTQYIDSNNLNSVIEMNNLIKSLKNELNNLSTKNIDITKMYDNMINDILNS